MLRIYLFLLFAAQAFAQKKPITVDTLDEVRHGGRGRGVDWAPDGKAYVFREQKMLKIYDPAAKSSKDLVSTEAMKSVAVKTDESGAFDWINRRTHDGGIEWSDSSKELIYSSGGDLFLVHVDSGKWEQLTKTSEAEHDAKFSPDGKSIAFRRESDLFVLDLETHSETRLTRNGTRTLINGGLDWVYPEELEIGTAFWWSPDSKWIAYLQFDTSREPVYPHEDVLHTRAIYEPERYPQAGENNADIHLGVVAAGGGVTRWLDVGDTRNAYLIGRAGWMPDSTNVYVIRLNRIQNKLEVFSINMESAAASTIFKESDPYWINLQGDAYFLADGAHFLWTSERDGFRHIYLYSNDGKSVKQLTHGSWEVRGINGFNDSQVFYTSTEGSSLEQHLYSVKLDGTGKRRIDKEPGMHNVSMSPDATYYLDSYSNLTSPPRTVLHSIDGAELAMVHEADRKPIEDYDILPSEIVSFTTEDGTQLYGRIIKPAGFVQGKKYPVIVNVYGGPGVELPIHNSWQALNIDLVYAHKGYVVWQAENRGGTGRGHAFETPIYHHLGSIELADQVAGVKYLISLGYADPSRVGIRGWSYGGFMTLNAVLNAPDIFKCGIAGAPVTSWMNYDTIYTERYMGLPSENAEAYQLTALPPKAENLKAKLMIVHNFEDDNVLFQNTLQMMNALQLAGKEFGFMLYPQKAHGVTGAVTKQMNRSMLDFFEQNLK
jgi:dipeptidyl-peptidase-4